MKHLPKARPAGSGPCAVRLNPDAETGLSGRQAAERMAEGLKIISVDGVAPSDESIAAGEYPFLVPGYAVVAHSEPAGSPARIFWDWLQSEEGQYLIAEMGYVPAAG